MSQTEYELCHNGMENEYFLRKSPGLEDQGYRKATCPLRGRKEHVLNHSCVPQGHSAFS